MKTVYVFVISLLLTGHALAGNDDSSTRLAMSDLDKLQGTWVGNEVGREGQVTMAFSGKSVSFKGVFPQEWYQGIGLMNEERMPKLADFLIEDCAIPDFVGKISKGIYKLDDDNMLTIAGAAPGVHERPSSFQPTEGIRVFQLRRRSSGQDGGFVLLESR